MKKDRMKTNLVIVRVFGVDNSDNEMLALKIWEVALRNIKKNEVFLEGTQTIHYGPHLNNQCDS